MPERSTPENSAEHYQFDPVRMDQYAQRINRALRIDPRSILFINYVNDATQGATQLAERVQAFAVQEGAEVRLLEEKPQEITDILASLTGETSERQSEVIQNLLTPTVRCLSGSNCAARLVQSEPTWEDAVNPEVIKLYQTAYNKAILPILPESWIKTVLPAKTDADQLGVSLDQYANMVLDAAIQDPQEMQKAQAILINEILNPGETLEFCAGRQPDGTYETYLWMDIKGQTFGNATGIHNLPDGEVFSSPKRGSLQGKLVIPYPLKLAKRFIPNLTLEFANGRVVKYLIQGGTTEQQEWIANVLGRDDGAKEVGEVALGSNRSIYLPVPNPLLTEKTAGSFHLALGDAYQYKEYEGEPVQVDNGVRSSIHEDLTRLMTAKYGGGEIKVDGVVIQHDGRYLDKRLTFLNPQRAA